MELSSMFKDVASIIAEKCVNPGTQRPYTISMIERALKDVHFSVDPKRGAKQQALHVRLVPPQYQIMGMQLSSLPGRTDAQGVVCLFLGSAAVEGEVAHRAGQDAFEASDTSNLQE